MQSPAYQIPNEKKLVGACLSTGLSLTFTLFDSGGDGISCSTPNASGGCLFLEKNQGEVLDGGGGPFTTQQQTYSFTS